MNRKSSEELKPKKTNRGFFSKFWKVGNPQPKEEKRKVSKSVDNLKEFLNEDNIEKENLKNLSENLNNSKRKSKSLDILNVEIEDINLPDVIEENNEDIDNFENEQNEINVKNPNNIELENKNKTENDLISTNNNECETKENINVLSNEGNLCQQTSQESIDDNNLKNSNSNDENNNDMNNKGETKSILSVVQEEQDSVISSQTSEKDNDKNEEKTSIGRGSSRKSNLTVLIKNNEIKNTNNNLTPKEFADKLYSMEETEYEGKQISLILTETDKFHEETLKYYMDNFDFNNVEIDEALRILCKKVVITGETQQIDRILTQFSKHYFDSNPQRHEVFLNEDVTHSIVYSLVLLNTDLHIVYNDNPNKKMTKKEFLKNTMTLLETMSENSFSSQMKIKSANIPNNNRRSYFDSPDVQTAVPYTSTTLPRNFMETQESKQKKWKKQMEQLLGELYNSIKTKRILQRTAGDEMECDATSYNVQSIQSQGVDAYPNKIQSLFGNEKSSYSTFSSVKSLISKGASRRSKEKNIYLSLPSLNASDSASYNSYGDISYSNKSYDKLNTISKSYNGINKSSNAKIVQKGALSRKHYMDQGKQRAKDRRWSKAHCALFIDPEVSQNGTCELRIWLESTSTSSSKKKGTTNKDFDDLFEATANEEDIEAQNLPYLNPNYHEVLPITHSVTSVVKNYTSFSYANRKNVFSLKLSSGSTYLFEASDEDTMKTWVNALNFWAARKSKEPLRGAVGNMEYGWNQVEKIEKPKNVTPEEILEAIPVYDPFDNSIDAESIKSYSSSNRDKNSRPSSIRSGRSGATSVNNRNDSSSINELNFTSLSEGNSTPVKEERTARSFTMKRFRSSSRSTSRHADSDSRSKTRSISLNRNETRSNNSNLRSFSLTRHPNNKSSNSDSTGSMPTILSNPNSNCNSPKEPYTKSDIVSPITTLSDNKSNVDQTSPLTKELIAIDNEENVKECSTGTLPISEDQRTSQEQIPLSHSNSSSAEDEVPPKKFSIPESTSSNDTKESQNNINSAQDLISPTSVNSINEVKSPNGANSAKNITVDDSNNNVNTESGDLKSSTLNTHEVIEESGLLHRRILSEPQLRQKREMDKNGTKKRSQSLSHYNENVNKSINSVVIPIPLNSSTASITTPNTSKSKFEESALDDTISQYSTLPYKRSQKILSQIASKHQSLMPEKFLNVQRFSIPPGGTLTIKKKIKKLRINDWTQPGVGFLLSTLSLEKQYESMKKQYIITEKELEYHKDIKQPMEDLYVFQSSAYQKACNNWKKKYLYLLDEKNKYGLYANILENYMKIDPDEKKLFPNTEEPKVSKGPIITVEPINTNVASISEETPENKPPVSATQDEIKSVLARKRQQQLDIMKKTATDLSIDSGKIENKYVLPEINVGNTLFDDEYEKEMEELALEQEQLLNMKK